MYVKIDLFFYIFSINGEILIKLCICFDVYIRSKLRRTTAFNPSDIFNWVMSLDLCIFYAGISCMLAALLFEYMRSGY